MAYHITAVSSPNTTTYTAREFRLKQIASRFFAGPPMFLKYSDAVTEQMLRLGVIDRLPSPIESFDSVTRFETEALLHW